MWARRASRQSGARGARAGTRPGGGWQAGGGGWGRAEWSDGPTPARATRATRDATRRGAPHRTCMSGKVVVAMPTSDAPQAAAARAWAAGGEDESPGRKAVMRDAMAGAVRDLDGEGEAGAWRNSVEIFVRCVAPRTLRGP